YPNGDALAYALDQFARGPSRRFGSSSTGRPLDLPGIDARPQPGRGASQFGASAVISGPRRGMQPPDVANDGYDAPTFEDYDVGLGNGNGLSTTPWATAHGTVPRISGPRGEYDEPRKPRTGLIAAMIGGLVLLLGVACVLVFALMNGARGGSATNPPPKTTVPNFVGQQYTAALSLAQSNHLKLNKQTEASDQPVDQVTKQDIASGQKVAYDTTITVTVSGGADTVTVPDVTKMTVLDACHALAADTLKLQCKVLSYQQSDSVDSGLVISTDPAAGATATPGVTVVNLVVSTGPAPTPTTPPQPTATPTVAPTPTGSPTTPP
ncbi:MAG TPA: PASTA domain-containing protein, partial [Ktedonobacterales bacterium]|nr:PASTA domain-containing protein [Ktedonobacterales bacterium]